MPERIKKYTNRNLFVMFSKQVAPRPPHHRSRSDIQVVTKGQRHGAVSRILVLGASGEIGKLVAAMLAASAHAARLLVRDANKVSVGKDQDILVGDATRTDVLIEALDGMDIVFSTLGLYKMMGFARKLVDAMKQLGTRRLLWTAMGGIDDAFSQETAARNYEALGGPPSRKGSYLHDQREAADFVAGSGLDVTIFRWNWLTKKPMTSEVVLTKKGEEIVGAPIFRRPAATFVMSVIDHPERYIGASLGVSSI
ncbi:MAG: NAD(P)H-binding protein [Gluconacetobacter sp.]